MPSPPTSTPWVPMWPNVAAAPSGANLAYVGDWVAGTYNDGDYVVKDGVAFVCVGGPTAVAPDASVWGLAPVAAGIGTSLPASPVDGQEFILVDSLLTPTYSWRFRYVTSITDAYKWVYLGGSRMGQEGVGGRDWNAYEQIAATTSYNRLTTVGPVLTFPRAGIYTVEGQAMVREGATGGSLVSFYMCLEGAALPAWNDGDGQHIANAADMASTAFARKAMTCPTAGLKVEMWYASSNVSNGRFYNRSMWVTPQRVA